MTFSEPGAPPEPQRTGIRIGLTDPVLGIPIRLAAKGGFLEQEALEPTFSELRTLHAVPALVAGALDVAVIDVATFIGERALGWDGLAIAAFGPVAEDRSSGVAVVEAGTWERRRDFCQRLWRACTRALEMAARGGPTAEAPSKATGLDAAAAEAAGLANWWEDCQPTAEQLDAAVRWAAGGPSPELRSGLAWLRLQPAEALSRR